MDVPFGKAATSHKEALRQMSSAHFDEEPFDQLTGLRTRVVFFAAVEKQLALSPAKPFCLMAIDIEHFKLYNEWHGMAEGDGLLKAVAVVLAQVERDFDAIAGYLLSDDFCLLLPDDPLVLSEVQKRLFDAIRSFNKGMAFMPAFGLYGIDDATVPVSTMYDRALMALAFIKGNYAERSCRFEPGMMQEMEEDHALLLEVQRALAHDEFTFHVQPLCAISSGAIVGVESLARWNHPERGLIPPGHFIPMLERNGLITALDLVVWEKACETLRAWMDKGLRPVPVSVNVSRRDIYAIDVADELTRLARAYDVEPSLLSVEITESAYVEDAGKVSDVVDRLRAAGFTVLMDDFGSGYSSLNTLKDLNVDVLKLDMKLLGEGMGSSQKTRGILESVINMAHLVDLRIVAEGVETEEQRDFLVRAGCSYAQGFGFYRPMPPEDFERLLADPANIDYRYIVPAPIHELQIRKMLAEGVLSDTMVDDILGPLAFYEVHDGKVQVVSANERYCRFVGISPLDLADRREAVLDLVYEADRASFFDAFERAWKNAPDGAEAEVRRIRQDGSTVVESFRVFFLRERDGHRLFYASLSDVTDQVRRARQLESSQRALSAVVGVSSSDAAFMSLAEENRRTAAAIFAQMSPGGMIGGYCEEGFPLYFANAAMVELLGYDSYEEFVEGIGGLVGNTIHPDDMASVVQDIGTTYYAGLEYTTTYRMPRKDGTWFWTLDKGKVVEAEDGRLAIVSACTDISEVMEAHQQLSERNDLLIKKNRELAYLNEDMPGGYHRCADTPGFEFLYVSERFLRMFGYTREDLVELFDDKFSNMVHPDDRELVAAQVETWKRNIDGTVAIKYRLKAKDGYRWVVDQSSYLEYEGTQFMQGVVIDVTNVVGPRPDGID
ncbi:MULTISPECIES: EAL domain-containing protein [Gordonibacter]|uniref:EAL domain-containing protein n=1 Tax=Gordonibacter faecis TaxID=3047475 RepID=A0ABT7DNF4_9ACTN|nr:MULTISPECIES: EAL domain-containing protein [unclassified Gordonibacter]MDJ1651066.1 EAL domain-containing protein [Gordonibacter sp. KGMB12511]